MKHAVILALLFLFAPVAWAQTPPIAEGPFQGNLDALTHYQCPDWFRDAKFGIWAHWGPQAVPMEGDWYAKHMYVPGHRQYAHHLATYGHPSEHGYQDLIALWKAEKWDPDHLMALYKKAGARDFVSMGSHHDNFYLWNSKLHTWNSVNMGPQRDVVGDWRKAARKYGLKFGGSEHLAQLQLVPEDANLHGDQINIAAQGGQPNIGFWDKADESVSWNLKLDKPGKFALSAGSATPHAEALFVVEAAGAPLTGRPEQTNGWADFRVLQLGTIEFQQPGNQAVTVRAREAATWKAINLRWVKLVATR